jgi:hypothetical protein
VELLAEEEVSELSLDVVMVDGRLESVLKDVVEDVVLKIEELDELLGQQIGVTASELIKVVYPPSPTRVTVLPP